MDQALARFERYIKRRFGQTSTLKHYISDLNIFIGTVGNKATEAITAQDIDTFVDSQIAAGLSPATINRRLASLHTFFEYLASERPDRICHGICPRLFAVISDERNRAMFGLMVGAGLREGRYQ